MKKERGKQRSMKETEKEIYFVLEVIEERKNEL